MRWFKHDTNSHNDEKIREIIHEFGCEGYGVYMICLEIIGEKIDKNLNPRVSISDRVLREKSRVSHQKLTKILSLFDQFSLISSNFSEGNWIIECHNLLKRLDNWSNRSVVTTEQLPLKNKNKNKNKNKKIEQEVIRGTRPTIVEIKDFFKNDTIANDFFDYYESNGWKVGGKTPMKNWQACARRWQRNNMNRGVAQKPTPVPVNTVNKDLMDKWKKEAEENPVTEAQRKELASMISKIGAK